MAGRIAEMAYGMRVAAGLSQSELARRMGTSQPAIARLENAGTVPGIEFLARLAASTGVDLSLTASGVGEVSFPAPVTFLPVGRSTRQAAPRAATRAKVAAQKAPLKKTRSKAAKKATTTAVHRG